MLIPSDITTIQLAAPPSSLAPFTASNIAHNLLIKLNSTNYLLWKTQLYPLLHSYDLANHIDGSTSPPPRLVNDQPNPT